MSDTNQFSLKQNSDNHAMDSSESGSSPKPHPSSVKTTPKSHTSSAHGTPTRGPEQHANRSKVGAAAEEDASSGTPAHLSGGTEGKASKDEEEEVMVEVGGPNIRLVREMVEDQYKNNINNNNNNNINNNNNWYCFNVVVVFVTVDVIFITLLLLLLLLYYNYYDYYYCCCCCCHMWIEVVLAPVQVSVGLSSMTLTCRPYPVRL